MFDLVGVLNWFKAEGEKHLPKKLEMPSNNGKLQRWLVNGEVKEYPVDPAPRKHQVPSVAALIDAAKHYAFAADDNLKAHWMNETAICWINPAGVQIILDDCEEAPQDGHRLNSISLKWEHMALWKLVEAAAKEGGITVDQQQLIQLLKTTLKVATEAGKLLPLVRNLKWTTFQSTGAALAPGDESLGKEITQKLLTGGETLPEQLTVFPFPFRNGYLVRGFNEPLYLQLQTIPGQQKFILTAEADDVAEILQDELLAQAEHIHTETGITCLLGTP